MGGVRVNYSKEVWGQSKITLILRGQKEVWGQSNFTLTPTGKAQG